MRSGTRGLSLSGGEPDSGEEALEAGGGVTPPRAHYALDFQRAALSSTLGG